jgi:hypothetical protein
MEVIRPMLDMLLTHLGVTRRMFPTVPGCTGDFTGGEASEEAGDGADGGKHGTLKVRV